MTYEDFLTQVIDQGIAGLTEHYPPSKDHLYDHHKDNREGGTAGFEACRDKTPSELSAMLADASDKRNAAYWNKSMGRYWWYRYFELEVEWVCNVVSCALHNEGKPTIVPPTARGMMQAAKIIGVGP